MIETLALFNASIQNNSLAHAYCCHGPNPTTTTNVITTIIQDYIATHHSDSISSSNHVDVYTLETSNSIKIEAIKSLQDHIKYGPSQLQKLFVCIPESHTLTLQAANAFLKTLEEPPKNVIFFLETNQIKQLLPTILSRCVSLYCPAPHPSASRQDPQVSFDQFKSLSLIEKCDYFQPLYDDKASIIQQTYLWLSELTQTQTPYTHPIYKHLLSFIKRNHYNINIKLQCDTLCLQIHQHC